MDWTEADFQNLLKYVIAEPTQKGYGEKEYGLCYNPSAAYTLLWTESDVQDLLDYVSAEPTQKGDIEQEYGLCFNPSAAYASLLEGASGSGNRVTAWT